MSVFLQPVYKASNIGLFANGVNEATTKIPDLYAMMRHYWIRAYLIFQSLFDDIPLHVPLFWDRKQVAMPDCTVSFDRECSK